MSESLHPYSINYGDHEVKRIRLGLGGVLTFEEVQANAASRQRHQAIQHLQKSVQEIPTGETLVEATGGSETADTSGLVAPMSSISCSNRRAGGHKQQPPAFHTPPQLPSAQSASFARPPAIPTRCSDSDSKTQVYQPFLSSTSAAAALQSPATPHALRANSDDNLLDSEDGVSAGKLNAQMGYQPELSVLDSAAEEAAPDNYLDLVLARRVNTAQRKRRM